MAQRAHAEPSLRPLAAKHAATSRGPRSYRDDSFDAVTGFNAFQFAADPAHALTEAGRVARPGAPIVIATWGRPDQCEAAGYVRAVGALLPPPPPGAPGPFALSQPGEPEDFAVRGGLTPGERRDVLCVWSFPDDETLLRALTSTGFAVRAIDGAGEQKAAETILQAVAPYRTSDGATASRTSSPTSSPKPRTEARGERK